MTGLGLGLGLSVAVKWCFVSCLVEKELSVSVINSKVCVSDFQRMQKNVIPYIGLLIMNQTLS